MPTYDERQARPNLANLARWRPELLPATQALIAEREAGRLRHRAIPWLRSNFGLSARDAITILRIVSEAGQ